MAERIPADVPPEPGRFPSARTRQERVAARERVKGEAARLNPGSSAPAPEAEDAITRTEAKIEELERNLEEARRQLGVNVAAFAERDNRILELEKLAADLARANDRARADVSESRQAAQDQEARHLATVSALQHDLDAARVRNTARVRDSAEKLADRNREITGLRARAGRLEVVSAHVSASLAEQQEREREALAAHRATAPRFGRRPAWHRAEHRLLGRLEGADLALAALDTSEPAVLSDDPDLAR